MGRRACGTPPPLRAIGITRLNRSAVRPLSGLRLDSKRVETGGCLDDVRVLAAQREVQLPRASTETLLDLIRPLESASAAGIVKAFEDAGAFQPVELNPPDEELLFELLEMWSRAVDELPPGIWELRCALIDDLHGLSRPSGWDRVQIDVAGTIVEITWDECCTLLEKLRSVAGSDSTIARFDALGDDRSVVELDHEQQSRLRVTLELWGVRVLPYGLARLLIALVRADPGGDVGIR